LTCAPRLAARAVAPPAPQPASRRRVPGPTAAAVSMASQSGSALGSSSSAQSCAALPQRAPCTAADPIASFSLQLYRAVVHPRVLLSPVCALPAALTRQKGQEQGQFEGKMGGGVRRARNGCGIITPSAPARDTRRHDPREGQAG